MRERISNAFSWYSININTILVYTCGISLLVLFLERLGIIFSYEAHTAGIDNNFDYAIIRSLAGYSIYPNPSQYPFAVNPYAPLFFICCKSAAAVFHITAADTMGVYRISRSVSLVADAGTCLLLFLTVRRVLKANRALAICCVALFFAILCFLGYTINRSDSLFLFFYSAALLVLLTSFISKSLLKTGTLALLATLCIYSKQNGISLLVLIPVWLLMEKNYRGTLQFLFFTAICSGGIFIYFEYFYTNHYFSAHTIHALKNKIDPRWFYVYVFKLMAGSYLTLPLAVSLVIAVKSIAENTHSIIRKLGVFFILQLLFNIALSFKWGSSVGYFNESFLVSFIIITTFCASLPSSGPAAFIKTTASYVYPALALLFLHITAQLFFFFINSSTESKEKFNQQVQVSNYVKKEIGSQNRYVVDLSDADFNFFKNLLYKEAAAPNIDAVSCCTLPGKLFDYTGLLAGFKSGKIMLIISKENFLPASLWGTDIRHYRKDTAFLSYNIFKYDSSVLNH